MDDTLYLTESSEDLEIKNVYLDMYIYLDVITGDYCCDTILKDSQTKKTVCFDFVMFEKK